MKTFKSFYLLFFLGCLLTSGILGCAANDSDSDDDDSDDDDSDDDNDDNDDDDDDNDDNTIDADRIAPDFPPDEGVFVGDVFVQLQQGGAPGHNGTAAAFGSLGQVHVAAVKGRILYLYEVQSPRNIRREPVDVFCEEPDLAVDDDGTIWLAYFDSFSHALKVAHAEPSKGEHTWQIEQVGTETQTGRVPSIALDANGEPHVLYMDEDELKLRLAVKSGETWSTQLVVSQVNPVMSPSLAVAPDGTHHLTMSLVIAGNADCYYLTDQTGNWTFLKIGTQVWYSSIALDLDGNVHVAQTRADWWRYVDYVTNAGGDWETLEVESSGYFFGPLEILVDAENFAHIVYGDEYEFLKYATNASGEFVVTSFFGNIGDGQYPSFALDAQGQVAMSHYNDPEHALKALWGQVDAFEHRIVDQGESGRGVLVIDGQGSAHVLSGDDGLVHSANQSGMWVNNLIERRGRYTALDMAIDEVGVVHVCYGYPEKNELRYARSAKGKFISSVVASDLDVGLQSSIVVLPDQTVRIAYKKSGAYDLLLASNDTGAWTTETVDAAVGSGLCVSLAVDPSENLHLGYEGGGHLYYAAKQQSVWSTEVVDDGNYTGATCALALDSSGDPKITYFDGLSDDLKYAKKQGEAWSIVTVDEVGEVGQFCDLSLNELGTGLITYYDKTNGDLKFAVPDDSGSVIIDHAGQVGQFVSMERDGQGNVHVLYTGEHARWYAVFPEDILDVAKSNSR